MDSGSLFHFPHLCRIGDFGRLISISHAVTGRFFTTLGETTDADEVMSPLHFGSDPVEIRVWINPEIGIRSPGHFWLRFWPWRRFALSEHGLIEIWFASRIDNPPPLDAKRSLRRLFER